ncbi:hypothetical protein GUY44_03290 [Pimelobacter simplex]|uniref:Uncharacterized protein n=1 Tax=Nocardioides simplex TaxID=2045 RepID=A0A0A1DPQ0_NOCSI|nr:hypothetical protein [Pimelobacter simplex]AIY19359.1 hypothetical protein KR76_25975 [Pimelobacter simplex]MCG8149488.1 hypothetical protein [Pimelobacter simplex]GEB16142.1 hypothetical protein NSI01_44570 [Pimelobacter simplex]SFM18419.1 hypothetical protein SAMN05421671_0135 [Pimelobacter simplex]
MDRRMLAAVAVAAIVGTVGGVGVALEPGGSTPAAHPPAGQQREQAAPGPLWMTSSELHDGDTVVPLSGVAFVTGVERVGDHWIVQDVPSTPDSSPRVLRVDRDGDVVVLADVRGHGDISDDGTQHVGLGPDATGYEITDLTTGTATRVPPAPDPGDPEGTALFDGEDVVTGWSPSGTTYYRSTPTGTYQEVVARNVIDGRFSPDRSTYAGLRVGIGPDCVIGGPAGDDDTAPWKQCPGGLGSASPYAPDGKRLVVIGHDGTGEALPTWAKVLDATTGEQVAEVPLPDDVFDVAMLADDELVVLSVSGPDGAQTTTVRTCDLGGSCTTQGSARGVAVLGGSR